MDQDIESLRVEFLRILSEIEKIAKDKNDERPYEPSAYESCIKIDGKSILPPVMTTEKRELCSKWKKEAIQVEEKLAQKHKATIVQAVQDRFAMNELKEPSAVQTNAKLDPSEPEETGETENLNRRQRRLSYTLDEPSPVLVAYMQRFGPEEQLEMTQDIQNTCDNPQCLLENYLTDLSQPPKLPSKEIPEKLPKEASSPGKENIPPTLTQSTQEWSKDQMLPDLPSPLKNDNAPTWARSPKIDKNQQSTDNQLSPSRTETNLEVTPIIKDDEHNVEPSSIVTVASSLLESETLPITRPSTSDTTIERTTAKEKIEAAVTALATEQQKEIEKLVALQAKEREELRLLFEEQQRQLIASVVNAVSSSSGADDPQVLDQSIRTDSTASTLTAINTNQISNRTRSPVIPTVILIFVNFGMRMFANS